MIRVGDVTIQEHYTEYAVRNKNTGDVLDLDTSDQEQAGFEAMTYPDSVLVSREVYVTEWVPVGMLSG